MDMEEISKAPDHIVRAILIELCDDAGVERKALSYLHKLTAKARAAETVAKSSSSAGNGNGETNGGSLKRKAESDIRICVQCKEPFYSDENVGKPCLHHDGELEVDDDNDFWADHDEDCHGTIDTDEMREEFPEGFFWNCCDKPGTAEGCTRGRHRAADDWRARLKADSPGSGSGSGSEGGEDEDGDEDE